MRCDVFLTRIICVFLAFIYGLKCWMERKGTNRALTNTVLNERGRRKSTRDVFNAFYFEFRVACLCCLFKVLCVVFSIYVHIYENEAKAKQHEKKNRRKKKQAKRKKKYRARDKSNRNVENNTQCSEFCLWEAKIVDVSLQIHNKTEANHARTLRYAIAIVPTNRFYYYQLEFLLGLFILFITFSSNAYTWRLPPVLYNHRGFHICVVYLHFSRQIKPTRKILNNLCVRTRDIYNGKCYYRLRAKVKIQFSFYIFFLISACDYFNHRLVLPTKWKLHLDLTRKHIHWFSFYFLGLAIWTLMNRLQQR